MRDKDWTLEPTFERDVHEHEVLISFDGDARGIAFRDWFTQHGCRLFNQWWEEEADKDYYE